MAHIVCNIGAVTFLMTTRPPSLDRRVFFRRRISNDSLIVDLVSVALSSDGPAAVLARRPREQPAARPGTKGGAKGARGGGGEEREARETGRKPPFGIVAYSESRHIIMPFSFVAYTRPPVFRDAFRCANADRHCPVCSRFRDGTSSFTFLLGQSTRAPSRERASLSVRLPE